MRDLLRISIPLFLFYLGINLSQAWGCPGCQNPNLPVIPSGGVVLKPSGLQWGLTLTTSAIWVRHEDGCSDFEQCDLVPRQPRYIHDQLIIPAELRGALDWGITRSLGLSVQLPLRIIGTTIHYELPHGAPYEPLNRGVHHRDEILVGLGDPWIAARLNTTLGNTWWFVARLGVSLPLGRIEPDPFAAGDRDEEHQHIQLGSGTFDPLISVAIARSLNRWQIGLYGRARFALYENRHQFQAGLNSLLSTRIAYRIQSRGLLQGTISWFRQGPEHWGGKVQEDGVLGRQEILLGVGYTLSFGGPQYLLNLQVPIWREIYQGPQTERGEIISPLGLSIGLQGML